MPTPNEIAAAAKRLRQNPDHHNLDQCRRIYGKAPASWRNENPEPVEIDGVEYTYTGTLEAIWYGQKIDADRKTLADAYIAEHATTKTIRQLKPRKIELDDDGEGEAVTREWLVEVLGEPREFLEHEVWTAKNSRGEWPFIQTSGALWHGYPYEGADDCFFVETRGDVLAFLRLVRWPLKGADDGN